MSSNDSTLITYENIDTVDWSNSQLTRKLFQCDEIYHEEYFELIGQHFPEEERTENATDGYTIYNKQLLFEYENICYSVTLHAEQEETPASQDFDIFIDSLNPIKNNIYLH